MAKKQTNKSTAKSETSFKAINIVLLTGAILVAAGIVWYTMKPAVQTADLSNLPKPDVTTLSPDQFTGTARLAYQAAKEIPEILAQLPCYCGCMQNFGHKSNLSCFHDTHGVECSMCQDIALDAHQMFKNGLSMDRILESIRAKFQRSAALHE